MKTKNKDKDKDKDKDKITDAEIFVNNVIRGNNTRALKDLERILKRKSINRIKEVLD